MAPEQNNSIPDDEIDLRSIGNKIISVIWYPFGLLLENIKTTIAFLLLGLLLAIASKYLMPKTYQSYFIIRPLERNDQVHVKVLGDIQSLLKLGDRKALARELKIREDMASSILGIRVTNFAFAKNRADSSNTTHVDLMVTDYNNLLPLQTAILSYLEEQPYYTKLKNFQKQNIALKSELIEKDIVMLDSLKKLQLASYDKLKVTDQNSVFLKDLINPTTTYTLSLERVNQKAGLIGQTIFLDNFQLAKGVVVSSKHAWPPRILIMCLIFVPASLGVCFVFLVIRNIVLSRLSKRH
jgi:LPS O-antigen subunit length determinant protein (WzzB/FepE family)